MRKDKLVSELLGHEVAITPSDLYHTDFKRATMGGYDKREVDEFLARLADVLEGLLGELHSVKETNEKLEADLREFHQMEQALRESMVASQRTSDDMIEAARRQAKSIVEEGRLKKLQIQIEASKLPGALARDVQLLQQQRSRLRVEIMSVLETHRQLLDALVPLGSPLSDPMLSAADPDEIAPRETGSPSSVEQADDFDEHDEAFVIGMDRPPAAEDATKENNAKPAPHTPNDTGGAPKGIDALKRSILDAGDPLDDESI